MTWGTSVHVFWALLVALLAVCYFHLQTYKDTYSPKEILERYGEWAIIAGASEGLGASWAELLCENGLNVVLLARRQQVMNQLAERLFHQYGCQVETFVLDLNDDETIVRKSFQNILERNDSQRFGLLVYNAAVFNPGKFLERPLEEQYKTINVNIRSVITFSHIFGTYFQQQQQFQNTNKTYGGMILMSSSACFTGASSVANYAATKAWNTQIALGLYREWKPLGLDVLACVAGATLTPNFVEYRTGKKTSNSADAMDFHVQHPDDVTRECLQTLGKIPSVATGPLNKFARFLLSRILTPSQSLELMSAAFESSSSKVKAV